MLKKIFRRDLLSRLKHKFIDAPASYGRPVPKGVADAQYFPNEGIRLVRALGLKGCEFVEGDFETWRPSETFDVIIFSECLGYAQDPGALTAAFLPFLNPGGHMVISHFRFGHWRALWRRVVPHMRLIESTTLTNSRRQTWDVKVLQPTG